MDSHDLKVLAGLNPKLEKCDPREPGARAVEQFHGNPCSVAGCHETPTTLVSMNESIRYPVCFFHVKLWETSPAREALLRRLETATYLGQSAPAWERARQIRIDKAEIEADEMMRWLAALGPVPFVCGD